MLTTPALWIANRNFSDKNIKTRYVFHDINAKITHRFSDRNKLSLSVYSARASVQVESAATVSGRIYVPEVRGTG